jgi:hypothetical protein
MRDGLTSADTAIDIGCFQSDEGAGRVTDVIARPEKTNAHSLDRNGRLKVRSDIDQIFAKTKVPLVPPKPNEFFTA